MPVAAVNPADVFPDGVDVDKSDARAFVAEVNTRFGEHPLSWAPYDTGLVMALTDTGLCPAPATDGAVPIRFGRRSLRDFRPNAIDIDADTTITDSLHVGQIGRAHV